MWRIFFLFFSLFFHEARWAGTTTCLHLLHTPLGKHNRKKQSNMNLATSTSAASAGLSRVDLFIHLGDKQTPFVSMFITHPSCAHINPSLPSPAASAAPTATPISHCAVISHNDAAPHENNPDVPLATQKDKHSCPPNSPHYLGRLLNFIQLLRRKDWKANLVTQQFFNHQHQQK